MCPGATNLKIELSKTENGSKLTLVHSGLSPEESSGHGTGWKHFLARLALAASRASPGEEPWKTTPPVHE
ncbi:SRPBCC domain-containing protein [uncultured Roseibium sp.]|uniref:SRPBCC domain-containing protein n=1 Tax=uncultured Roseibium sp. TaxID=1936171 RepID=UPI00344B4EE5